MYNILKRIFTIGEKTAVLNVIVNRMVRRVDRLVAQIETRLKSEGVVYRIFYTDKEGAAIKYGRSLSAAGGKEFLIVGGDGTINEVLTGLVDPSVCTIAIIPAGSGNDFAAAANIPLRAKALDTYFHGTPTAVDYIECGTRRSMNIVGTGIDVDILRRCGRIKFGSPKGKYFRALLSSLIHYKGTKLRVTVNGRTQEYRALIAAVCNGKQLGGGIPLCPPARIDDGQLELVIVDCPPRYKFPFELIRLMRGKLLKRPIAHHVACKDALVEGDGALFVQYDGEICEERSLNARVVSGGLKLYRG